jgi:hypothetical protein
MNQNIKSRKEIISEIADEIIIEEIIEDIIEEIIEEEHRKGKEQEEQENTTFVEQIFKTIIQIIMKQSQPQNNVKLKQYEYHRYGNILILLREFLLRFCELNMMDCDIKGKLYGYLGYSYKKSKYYKISRNIEYSFKQKYMSVRSYPTPQMCNIKTILHEYLQKQYTFLGVLQNKEILKTINKDTLDDLIYKIIFELTIYITYFT